MGTAQYLSPEQAQGQPVDFASDIYSIGVMLYEMLTGVVPFGGDTAVAIALRHVSDPPTPIRQLQPDVHPALEAAVMRALEKDPAHRYGSAEEFAAGPRDRRSRRSAPAILGRTPPPGARWSEPRSARRTSSATALALDHARAAARARPRRARVRADPGRQGRGPEPGRQAGTAGGGGPRAARAEERDQGRSRARRPPQSVVSHEPGAGDEVDKGATVTLRVSAGPGRKLVPEVEGKSETSGGEAAGRRGLQLHARRRVLDLDRRGRRDPHRPGRGHGAAHRDRGCGSSSARARSASRCPDVVGLDVEDARDELSERGPAGASRSGSSPTSPRTR